MKGAGGGRPRKPEAQRRNRNPVYKEDIRIPGDARVDVIPEPALPFEGIRKQIWEQIWEHPIALLWQLADVAVITRMVVLQTTPEVYTSPRLLAELRQLEDRFLLNPYARVQQRVIIGDEDDDVEEDAAIASIAEYRRQLGA